MATKLTGALLGEFEKKLQIERERFRSIEKDMNTMLNHAILWNDPIGRRFRARYDACMNPLHTKLFPAMERYQGFLHMLRAKITTAEYKDAYESQGINFTARDGVRYSDIDKAFSQKHDLGANELVLTEKQVDDSSRVQGTHPRDTNQAFVNKKWLSTEKPPVCEVVGVAAHEAAHVKQDIVAKDATDMSSQAAGFRSRTVNADDCIGAKVKEVGYEQASDSCKDQYAKYWNSPREVDARKEQAAARQACEEMVKEHHQFIKEAKTNDLPNRLYEKPKAFKKL